MQVEIGIDLKSDGPSKILSVPSEWATWTPEHKKAYLEPYMDALLDEAIKGEWFQEVS